MLRWADSSPGGRCSVQSCNSWAWLNSALGDVLRCVFAQMMFCTGQGSTEGWPTTLQVVLVPSWARVPFAGFSLSPFPAVFRSFKQSLKHSLKPPFSQLRAGNYRTRSPPQEKHQPNPVEIVNAPHWEIWNFSKVFISLFIPSPSKQPHGALSSRLHACLTRNIMLPIK